MSGSSIIGFERLQQLPVSATVGRDVIDYPDSQAHNVLGLYDVPRSAGGGLAQGLHKQDL